MADITNKNIAIPGVNSATNFVQQYSFLLDLDNVADITAVGTHNLVKLPADEALVGLKLIIVKGLTSGGSATAQIKVNGTAINTTALALAGLAEGLVHNYNVAGIKAYGENTLQLTVGTAAFTGGKVLVIAETIPAKKFTTAG